MPSSTFGKTSRRASRRTSNESTKSIDGWYETPAHSANPGFPALQAIAGHTQAVELLLNAGAPVNQPNAAGYTALHCAAANRHHDLASGLPARPWRRPVRTQPQGHDRARH